MDFLNKYEELKSYFNLNLDEFCSKIDCQPQIFSKSLTYSLNIGGKRIRPVLVLAVAELLNIPKSNVINFAIAIELIHTFSLIHDDLPCMDNDDFRRGQPTNHKVFGEANAVLAGDGLLNTAYSVLINECFKGGEYISAAKYICDCAGIYGMLSGQAADIYYSKCGEVSEENLEFICNNKTGKLISAAIMCPCILSGGKDYSKFKRFSEELGYLFQLTDDVLDVEGSFEHLGKSIGKDIDEDKLTGVKVFGLEACKIKCDVIYDNCLRILEGIEGDCAFLKDFTLFVLNRIN